MDGKHLRPRSDLPFNKPQVKATKTVKPTIFNRKNDDFEKMKKEIENLKKEIEKFQELEPECRTKPEICGTN